jgi:hypothetical protein
MNGGKEGRKRSERRKERMETGLEKCEWQPKINRFSSNTAHWVLIAPSSH